MITKTQFQRINVRERLFYIFVLGLFIILLFVGVAMVIVFILGNDALGLRLISAFGTMFASLVGLGTGYLLAQARLPDEEKKEISDVSAS